MVDCLVTDESLDPQKQTDRMPSSPPPSISRLLKRSPVRDLEEGTALVSGRRESFLQDRRDRLAQRRQQHDQVLARGRVDVSAKLEALRASLSAAQAARNAIYARIAANGSKEVARVQLVVQQNKEKLRLEREAKRLALEVKQAEAEKRREIALRGRRFGRRSASPRAISSDGESMECEPLPVVIKSPTEAATTIQRFWRAHVAAMRAKKFLALHLDYETVGEIPFDVIADVIKTRSVIDCAGRILLSLGLVDNLPAARRDALCRMFLSTFMIVGHPKEILMRQGVLEDRLVQHAAAFAKKFVKWIRSCASGRYCTQASVRDAWVSFSSAFDHWKQDDSANLVEAMVAQYCELDLIYQIVKMDSDPIVAAEYQTAIKDNQLMLLTRIRRIAGEATRSLVRDAVLAARRKRLPKKPRPLARNEGDTTTNTMTPNVDAIKFFSLGQRQTRLTNRQLIHELSLDSAFQITNQRLSEADAVAEETMKVGFFNSLQTEMRAGRSVSWIPIIVQECKMRLLRLVMPDSPTFKAITSAFDVPHIEAQCRQNSYDFIAFTGVVLEMMKALCSPARDGLVSDIALLRGTDDVDLFAKRINAIFLALDTLLLDSANFHLTMSSSRLLPEAIPYEQTKFHEDCASGKVTLNRTTSWMQKHSAELRAEHAARELENLSTSKNKIPSEDVFRRAYVDLCSNQEEALPETFDLDHDRIMEYRSRVFRIVRTASYLMTARNLMRPKLRHLNPVTWTSLRDRLGVLMTGDDLVDTSSIAAEVNNHLDLAYIGTEPDRAERHYTLNSLISKSQASDPIQQLLLRRVRALMMDGTGGRDVTSSQITSAGFEDFSIELQNLLRDVQKLGKVNWQCYHGWYHKIVVS